MAPRKIRLVHYYRNSLEHCDRCAGFPRYSRLAMRKMRRAMQSTLPVSKTAVWIGRVMSALPVLLILFGSVVKLMKTPSVVEGFVRAGLPLRLIVPVGIIE